MYGSRVDEALAALADHPDVKKLDVYNAWDDGRNSYNGVNAEVHLDNGMIFELQFHTPESQRVKDQLHRIYKKKRVESDPAQMAEYDKQMWDLAEHLSVPDGVSDIPTGVVGPSGGGEGGG